MFNERLSFFFISYFLLLYFISYSLYHILFLSTYKNEKVGYRENDYEIQSNQEEEEVQFASNVSETHVE